MAIPKWNKDVLAGGMLSSLIDPDNGYTYRMNVREESEVTGHQNGTIDINIQEVFENWDQEDLDALSFSEIEEHIREFYYEYAYEFDIDFDDEGFQVDDYHESDRTTTSSSYMIRRRVFDGTGLVEINDEALQARLEQQDIINDYEAEEGGE